MKRMNMKMMLAVLAAAAVWMAAFPAFAETKISVSGTGETQISADTAIVSLGVSARNQDVLKAQQKVNEVIAEIRKALMDQGVEEDCINTDYMNIYAIYDYSNEMEEVSAYNANSTLAIKATELENVGLLIDTAFAAGANMLNGISFSASDTEAAQEESLKKAVEEAKKKAEVLAEASGLTITGMEIVSEGNVFSYDNSVGNFSAKRMEAMDAGAGGTVVQAAKLIVTATVNITFTAE